MKSKPVYEMERIEYIKATGGMPAWMKLSLHQRINYYPFSLLVSKSFHRHRAEIAANISLSNTMLRMLSKLRD